MKLSTLKESPQYYKEALALIEKNFHYQAPEHFAIDFAPLMHESNHAHNFILIDEVSDTLVAHIGVNIRIWEKQKVALLGGIAVSENFQGQGLFKKLFEEVLKRYENQVQAFVLWSDLHEMYKKYDFLPMKNLLQTGQASFVKPQGYNETNFSKLSAEEKKEIVALYQIMSEHYHTLERSPEDWQKIFAIHSTKLFIHKNKSQHICRYFCLSKGMDLHDIIHEIGFQSLEEKEVLLQELSPFKLWLPSCERANLKEAQELILALVRGTLNFTDGTRLYLSGLDSI